MKLIRETKELSVAMCRKGKSTIVVITTKQAIPTAAIDPMDIFHLPTRKAIAPK